MRIPDGPIIEIKNQKKNVDRIIHLKYNVTKNLYVTLYPDRVTLWQCEPMSPICMNQRDSCSVDTFGINMDIEWKKDGSMICLSTHKSWIYLYQVTENKNSEYYLRDIYLEQICLLKASSKITCMSIINEAIFLSNEDCKFEILQWPNNVNESLERRICNILPILNPDKCNWLPIVNGNVSPITIVKIYSYMNSYIVCLLSIGAVFILYISPDSDVFENFARIHDDDISTCVSINYITNIIIVGYQNSGIIKGYLPTKSNKNRQYIHMCSYLINIPQTNGGKNLGPVKLLQWSSDYTTLAASWLNNSIALFSKYGSNIAFFHPTLLNINTTSIAAMDISLNINSFKLAILGLTGLLVYDICNDMWTQPYQVEVF
ncbi:hypothetical protein HZS_3179 [Henneguya salminicola]|nr:hypothetical protein HZS_3179 [Henneguya salminicola]